MNSCQKHFSACLLALLTQAAFAQSPPALGTAANFAVLAKDAVTCTNGTIAGNVGTFSAAPAGSVTQTICPVTGTVHVGDGVAAQAFNDFVDTYALLAPKPGDVCTALTGTLAGATLSPGTYCFPAAAALTGVLTLDGPSNASWIFKIGSGDPATGALTGTNFSVVMAGGGQACNVTWWVAQAATMTDSNLKGSILSGAATTLTRGTLIGRDFAKADVTITGTAVSGCEAQPGPGPGAGTCSDRVTGGGYLRASGNKANFGVTAGIRKGAPRGHLTYVDHGAGLKVKGTGVTAYVVVNANTRHIEGTASINGVAGAYTVDVTDNGEPGKKDRFAITLSNGYSASGELAGGNIQLHKRHCGKGPKGDHGHDQGDDGDDGDDRDHDDEDDRGQGDDEKEHRDTKKPYGRK